MSLAKKFNAQLREDPRLFFGAAASSATGGITSIITAPILVSAIIGGFALSEKAAGFIMSAELVTIAIVSFLVAPKMGVWSRRNTAFSGALIAIVGHLVSASMSDPDTLMACRMLAGAGAGLVVAAGNAVVASANNPDRLYSMMMIVTGVAHTVLLSAGPFFTTRWGYSGAYGMEALFLLLLLPLIWRIPAYYVPKKSEQSEAENGDSSFPLVKAIMVCAAMTLFFARDGALWGFAQEIGKRTGLDEEQIGAVLGMAGVLGLSGAILVAFINVRFGRALPMTIGLVSVTLLSLMLCLTDNPMLYSIGVSVWQAATFFAVPYIFGIAAALDPRGRVIAACGGCLLLGGSLGPAISGILLEFGGYNALAVFIVVAMVIVTGLVLTLNHGLSRQNNIPGSEPTDGSIQADV